MALVIQVLPDLTALTRTTNNVHGQHTPQKILDYGREAEAPPAPQRPRRTSPGSHRSRPRPAQHRPAGPLSPPLLRRTSSALAPALWAASREPLLQPPRRVTGGAAGLDPWASVVEKTVGLPTTGTRPTELLPAKPRRRSLPAALPGCGSTSDQVARQGAGCGPGAPEPAVAPARAAVYSEPRPPERQLGRRHEGAERQLSHSPAHRRVELCGPPAQEGGRNAGRAAPPTPAGALEPSPAGAEL